MGASETFFPGAVQLSFISAGNCVKVTKMPKKWSALELGGVRKWHKVIGEAANDQVAALLASSYTCIMLWGVASCDNVLAG